jgi:hypothetical protein
MDGHVTPPEELLARWRAGDAAAGARLAERSTRWYRAVCLARLGPGVGREAFQRACGRFQQGVSGVLPPQFAAWSHGIVAEEVAREGARLRTFTSGEPAGAARAEVLRGAARGLSPEDVRLLHVAYAGTDPRDLERAAAHRGGLPLALSEARDALKAALSRAGAGAFALAGVLPDHAPLGYFEAGRTSAEEDSVIEGWLLQDEGACLDLVDMAPWALALRSGALETLLAAPRAPEPAERSLGSALEGPLTPPSPPPQGRGIRWEAPAQGGFPGWAWAVVVLALVAVAAWGWLRG